MGISTAQEPRGGLIDLQPPRGALHCHPVHSPLCLPVLQYSLSLHVEYALSLTHTLLWFAPKQLSRVSHILCIINVGSVKNEHLVLEAWCYTAWTPIQPVLATPGTRDFLPEDLRVRQWLFGEFEAVARLFGFEQFETPVLESEALFTRKAGDEITQQLYNFEARRALPWHSVQCWGQQA